MVTILFWEHHALARLYNLLGKPNPFIGPMFDRWQGRRRQTHITQLRDLDTLMNLRHNKTGKLSSIFTLFMVAILISLAAPQCLMASGGQAFKWGFIAGKGLVLSEGKHPIWVEYTTDGDVLVPSELGEAVGDLQDAIVMSAYQYKMAHAAFQNLKAQFKGTSDAYVIMGRDEYLQTQFKLADKKTSYANKPPLASPGTFSVVVRAESYLYDSSMDLLLLESPLDLRHGEPIASTTQTLLLNKETRAVIYQSPHNIGYKAAFYSKDGDWEDNSGQMGLYSYDHQHDSLWAPIKGARVYSTLFSTGQDTAGDDGRFMLNYVIPPCPGFSFTYNHDVVGELSFQTFNPKSKRPLLHYFVSRPVFDMCVGYSEGFNPSTLGGLSAQQGMLTEEISQTGNKAHMDARTAVKLTVDLAMLTGEASLKNQKRFGVGLDETLARGVDLGETLYSTGDNPEYVIKRPEHYDMVFDFNGDGEADKTRLRMVKESNESETWFLDVWFAGHDPMLDPPDLTRLADSVPDFGDGEKASADLYDRGLLETISKVDLEDTDTFVFRASNGMLLTYREGLRPSDTPVVGGTTSETDARINYRIKMRGPIPTAPHAESIADWGARSNLNADISKRHADHLRPGEWVKVVMINRATGYIGSQTVQVGLNSSGAGLINFTPPEIEMRPPNLKIRAERTYMVEAGATKGDQEHLIGFEGSGLVSDAVIKVTTEWLDWDGTPLPEDLKGYTGRLAKIVAPNELDGSGGPLLAQFEIVPGVHTQIVKLPKGDDAASQKGHYYIQVSGEPVERNPSFSSAADFKSLGAGEGLLQYRPSHYVPVKVAVYDEKGTRAAEFLRNKLIAEGGGSAEVLSEVASAYKWVYRPEMQFSLYDLSINTINRKDKNGNNSNALDGSSPGITSSDEAIDLIYTLLGETLSVLKSFGVDREFIFSLGGNEFSAKIVGEDNHLEFDDPSMLSQLAAEDFLMIRLYQNSDESNILWEYAYDSIYLSPDGGVTDEIVVSADDPVVNLNMVIGGYSQRKSENQGTYHVSWLSSEGYFSTSHEAQKSGYFASTLTMPPVKGATTTVRAQIGKGADDGYAFSPLIRVIAGEPQSVEIVQSGETAIGDIGEVTIKATVRDQWGNPVEDGTGIDFFVDGDSYFQSDSTTTNGVATATLRGLETPGEKIVTVVSGDVHVQETILVENVELQISMETSLLVDQYVPVTVKAVTKVGSMDGRTVILRQSRGRLKENVLVFSGETATTTFYTGKFKGPGSLHANFAGSNAAVGIDVVLPAGAMPLTSQLIIGDKIEDGSVTIESPDGDTTRKYTTQSTLTVNGAAGDVVPVEIGSLSNPAVESVLHYSMSLAHADKEVRDSYGVIHGVCTNITSTSESKSGFDGSFVFAGDSGIRIGGHSDYDKENNLGFSLKFKPSEALGTLVNNGLRSQRLSFETDGRLKYEISTDNGGFTVRSKPIAMDSWHTVAAHYRDNKLLLAVDDALYSADASGNLIRVTGPVGMEIGVGYNGLMNQYRVIDWNAPLLLTLPNGKDKMDVTIGSEGTADVIIQSTGKLGDRSIFTGESGFSIANGFFVPQAIALRNKSAWTGEVGTPSKKRNMAAWVSRDYGQKIAMEFLRGAVIGDSSTPAGIIGDIALGSLPFGDLRDVLLHDYYLASSDPEMNKKYDKVVCTLACLGLSADVLIASGIGEVANIAISGLKVFVKQIDKVKFFSFHNALGKYVDDMAKAAIQGDFALLKNMLPFMQLTAAIVIDKDLRNLVCGAITSIDDLMVWVFYTKGWKAVAEIATVNEPGPFDLFFIESAYAAKLSKFKKVLRTLLKQHTDLKPEEIGKITTECIRVLNESAENGAQIITHAYEARTIEALNNIFIIGERAAVEAASNSGKLGRTITKNGNKVFFGRLIGQLIDDLGKVNLVKIEENLAAAIKAGGDPELLQAASDPKSGLKKLIEHLDKKYNRTNYPKGAAHHIRVIADMMDDVVGVELKRIAVKLDSGVTLGDREYDLLASIGGVLTRIEAKSWLPDNIKKLTREYLAVGVKPTASGKEIAVKNKQLLTDLVGFAENDYKGFKWVFDKGMDGNEGVFKDTIEDILLDHGPTRGRIYELLGKSKFPTEKRYKDWVAELVDKLDDFMDVKTT